MKFNFLFLFCFMTFWFSHAFGQVPVGESISFTLETPHPYPSKGSEEKPTWVDMIYHPDASFIKVHFAAFDLGPKDRVVVRSLDGKFSYTYRGKGPLKRGEFYATYIPSDAVAIELYAPGKDGGYGYRIDGYVWGYSQALPGMESVCGTTDWKNAACYGGAKYRKAKAVTRYIFIENGSAYSCTGWLAGCEGHVLSNNHCISSQSVLDTADFEFFAEGTCGDNCDSWQACPGTVWQGTKTLVATNANLDYSLYKLGGDPQVAYGYLQARVLINNADIGEEIFIPEHPHAWGKKIAYDSDQDATGKCTVVNLNNNGCTQGAPGVHYYCDTAGGSSGSPVIATSDYHVVGLHSCGGCPGSTNSAIQIDDIGNDLNSQGKLPKCFWETSSFKGELWTWGANLGDGTTNDSYVPVLIQSLTDVQAISAGNAHSLALKFGEVWAWGFNYFGQLGDGTNNNSLVPVQVSNLMYVREIAGGENHSLAVQDSGTVWAWGDGVYGQLGNGTNYGSNVPVQVLNLTDAQEVAGGQSHSLALKSDGTVWAWGQNDVGQLGNGTWNDSNVPVQVLNLTDIQAITSGLMDHSLALKSDGTVWAWGANWYGQLGNGTNTDSNVPVQVLNLTGVQAIAAGWGHSLALKRDGTVWAWGRNYYGQLGNGTDTDSNVPVQVLNLTGVVAIAAGAEHSLALKGDGTVWAWGSNSHGQLGIGVWSNANVPTQVLNLTGVQAIAAGGVQSMALAKQISLGDVDNDGQLSAFDASLILQCVVGSRTCTPEEIARADIDGDGSLTAYDASLILQCLVGLCNSLPQNFLSACQGYGYCP